MDSGFDPVSLLRPRRKIEGYSAVLLPFREDGAIDWDGFCAHVQRTAQAGLTPAVNMDTGFGSLLTQAQRIEVLSLTRDVMRDNPPLIRGGGEIHWAAGAYVLDQPGSPFDLVGYVRQAAQVQAYGGTPVIFQSYGLCSLESEDLLDAYAATGRQADQFIAFELGTMFAPFGRIYDLATFSGLLGISQCIGLKHSSLSRQLEWQRLMLRDGYRPDFKLFTGNDLAIDMVMYGSDYLLGISTFAPDLFALRDGMWLQGDPEFYTLNDRLQYLGSFAFRAPVPAYKHSAAQFLKLRGWTGCDHTHPASPQRPQSDVAVLAEILRSLEPYLEK